MKDMKTVDVSNLIDNYKNSSNVDERIRLSLEIAQYYTHNSNPGEGLKFSKECKELITEDHEKYPDYLQFTGTLYEQLEEAEKAIDLFEEYLGYALQGRGELSLEQTYNFLGCAHKDLGKYPEAIEYYMKAKEIFEQKDDKEGIGGTSLNIGHLYKSIRDYDIAIKYYSEALQLMKKSGKPSNIAMVYTAIGDVLRRQEKLDESEEKYKTALQYSEESGDLNRVLRVYNNLGLLKMRQKEHTSAVSYYVKALEYAEKVHSIRMQAILLTNIGKVEFEQGNLENAKKYLNSGMELAKKHKLETVLTSNYRIQSQLYRQLGDAEKVYDFFEESVNILADLNNKQANEKIRELEVRLETKQKEHEAEIYKLKNTELKNALVELQEAYVQQEQAHQEILELERKNSILAMAVTANHEITQPLMVLSGNIEMLHMKLEMDESKYLNDKAWGRITESIANIKKILAAYKESSHFEFDKYTDNVDMISLKNS